MTDINEFILNKLDKMDEKMDDQGKRLDEYNRQLEIHILMSKNLEKQQAHLNSRVTPLEEQRKEQLVLAKLRRSFWKKVITIISVIAAIAGVVVSILQLH